MRLGPADRSVYALWKVENARPETNVLRGHAATPRRAARARASFQSRTPIGHANWAVEDPTPSMTLRRPLVLRQGVDNPTDILAPLVPGS